MPAESAVDEAVPDAVPLETETRAGGPTDRPVPELAGRTVPGDGTTTAAGCPLPIPQPVEAAGAHARVNFNVDPTNTPLRGIIAIPADGWIERDFVPTAVLIEEAKQRRAERRRRRRVRRDARDGEG
jgi:hypothetical protein